jgi:hypothetical protein
MKTYTLKSLTLKQTPCTPPWTGLNPGSLMIRFLGLMDERGILPDRDTIPSLFPTRINNPSCRESFALKERGREDEDERINNETG